MYAFGAIHLLESMCRTHSELCASVASSWEEVLRDKSLLEKEAIKISDQEDRRVRKLSKELDVSLQKFH